MWRNTPGITAARWATCLFVALVSLPQRPAQAGEEAVTRRTVEEMLPWLEAIAGRPFGELAEAYDLEIDVRAKGSSGMLLEAILGLPPDSRTKDFLDAELKTNKSTPDGVPLETMFITQIGSHIDDLLEERPYETTWLAGKISRVVYVPVVKEGPPETWYFLRYHDVYTGPGSSFFDQLKSDYEAICRQIEKDIEKTGQLHTASGLYLQIRTKDRKPYTPIHSQTFAADVSDKNFAFYFKKDFMLELLRTAAP